MESGLKKKWISDGYERDVKSIVNKIHLNLFIRIITKKSVKSVLNER